MRKIFQKQRELFAVIIWIAIIACLIWLVILPLLGKINDLKDQIQEEEVKQEGFKQRLGQLPVTRQQFENLEANKDVVGVLLDKDKAVSLIEKLEKLATETGNEITITVQDTATAKPVATKSKNTVDTALVDGLPSQDYLQMKIKLSGDYNNIVNFVVAMENFEYYGDVIAIEIKNSEKDPSDSGSSTSVSVGDLFGARSINSSGKFADMRTKGKLEATLDSVFYINK